MKKIALITGITGQDGSYLAEFLLRKNYQVHGVKRRSSTVNNYRIDEIYKNFGKKRFVVKSFNDCIRFVYNEIKCFN